MHHYGYPTPTFLKDRLGDAEEAQARLARTSVSLRWIRRTRRPGNAYSCAINDGEAAYKRYKIFRNNTTMILHFRRSSAKSILRANKYSFINRKCHNLTFSISSKGLWPTISLTVLLFQLSHLSLVLMTKPAWPNTEVGTRLST